MPTAIRTCTCKHDYQDKRYGKGRRVHNEKARQSNRDQEYRCTVCSKDKSR